jgi:hypothetical protein
VTAFSDAYADLDWLAGNGALDGVAEVLRERRRQIAEKGYTSEHDDQEHEDGGLMSMVVMRAAGTVSRAADGRDGPAECERSMAEAGALAAAEIDRLQRL